MTSVTSCLWATGLYKDGWLCQFSLHTCCLLYTDTDKIRSYLAFPQIIYSSSNFFLIVVCQLVYLYLNTTLRNNHI